MSAPTKSVVFEDFHKGEFGSIGAREAGKRGPGLFHAKNMVLYRNGLLGPRAGLKSLATPSIPNGVLWGMGFQGTPGFDLWLVVGNQIIKTTTGGAAASVLGTLAVTPTKPVVGQETVTSHSNISVSGDKTYDINHLASTMAGYSGSPGGTAIALYGQRLMVAGAPSNPNRVYYSAAADFTSWPALNYFDVGNQAGVAAMFAQRGHLSIGMQNAEWWVLTGVPGVNDTLRRVTGGGVHPWVFSQQAAALLGDDDIIFVPLDADFPAIFNGTIPQEMRHLNVAQQESQSVGYVGSTDIKVSRGFRPDDVCYYLPSFSAFGLRRQGAWTFHILGIGLAPYIASDAQGHLYFATAGAAGVSPIVYVMDIHLDRPAFTSDANASPGDGSSTPFDANVQFPWWWAADDRECLVRSVTVEFVTWATGSASTNHFDVDLLGVSRYNQDATGPNAAATQHFDQADASGGVAVHRRQTFLVGDQGWSSGFQVLLSNIRGVAIERVVVGVDERPIVER